MSTEVVTTVTTTDQGGADGTGNKQDTNRQPDDLITSAPITTTPVSPATQ